MKKAYLTDNEKHIMFTLRDAPNYECDRENFNLSDRDFDMSIRTLISRNVVRSRTETNEVGFLSCELTERGLLYLQFNPTLENPKTEEQIKQEEQKLRREERIWDFMKILISTIVGAFIAYFVGK